MPLEVGIVGAGIAGLSSAIGLRKSGARVEVYLINARTRWSKFKHCNNIIADLREIALYK